MDNEKYLSNALLSKPPYKKLNLVLKEGSVSTVKLSNDAVTNDKIADGAVTINKLDDDLADKISLSSIPISKFQIADSVDKLPSTPNDIGWIINNHLYLYVGKESQLYIDCGELRGPQGVKGEKGERGIQGVRGVQGVQGPKGDKGLKGDKGDIGLTGPQGPQGEQGPKGLVGETGPKGDMGERGPQGEIGPQGPKGDAFKYSDFTTAQLASLKGPKGDKGDPGIQGAQGQQGLVGPQGSSGVLDASSKTLVNDITTGGETDFLSAEVGKLGIMTYDCSKGGSVVYSSIQDAINQVPSAYQKGGMTIAVVLRGSGTYLNYYLPLRDWSNNASDWSVGSLGISQQEGDATNVAISQKAFTDKMNTKVDVSSLVNEITEGNEEGETNVKVPTSKAVKNFVSTAEDNINSSVEEKNNAIKQDINTFKNNVNDSLSTFKNSINDSLNTTKSELNASVDEKINTLKADVDKKVNSVPKFLSMSENEYDALEEKEADTYYMLTEE